MSQTIWRLWLAGSLAQPSVTAASSFLSSFRFAQPSSKSWVSMTRRYNSVLRLSKKNHNNNNDVSASLAAIAASKARANAIAIGRNVLQPKFSFPLDDWQLEAGGHVWNGHNVIVCAPTGAGKTVVGEMALHAVVQNGHNGIYTTPLKALSNQKWNELRERFGGSEVGLSTGDISINRGARLTVMTTEVYRNMVWRATSPTKSDGVVTTDVNGNHSNDNNENDNNKMDNPKQNQIQSSLLERLQRQDLEQALLNRGSELESNAVVVLDEFHYMGLAGRGGVWEEAIICSPSHTQIIGLSATLPNGRQLADWMQSVTGRTTMLVEAPGKRPVPLRYVFATRDGLFPLFRDPDAGPGAPKGLLGLRGDGSTDLQHTDKKKKKKGFKADENDASLIDSKISSLPHGLQPNPMLSVEAQKRMNRVNRAIQRQKMEAVNKFVNDVDEDFEWDGQKEERRYNNKRRSAQSYKHLFQMSAREERQQRERLLRSEMRKAVPSLPILLKRLQQKRLLPAIIFIFSRAGCDEAARNACNFMKGFGRDNNNINSGATGELEVEFTRSRKIRKQTESEEYDYAEDEVGLVKDQEGRSFRSRSNYVSEEVLEYASMQRGGKSLAMEGDNPLSSLNLQFYAREGLLNYDEVQTVASRIKAFNEENDEIAFPDDIVEQYLFGVGSHHAGMLPAHKAFVESLYRAQLMKAVFSTETLAAGINMPARTTAICALAKRDDTSSMSLLETSNLLQMAGRAGRRGMDTDGTCVIVATPFETHEDAVMILTNPIKPITSQFTPSYSLAVNLIARGNGKLDVAKELVKKSFAMWEKRKAELNSSELNAEDLGALLQQQRFMSDLIVALNAQVEKKRIKYNVGHLKAFLDILRDRDLLKKWSKSYVGLTQKLELEQTTVKYLELELERMTLDVDGEDAKLLAGILDDDRDALLDQLEVQRQRVVTSEKQVHKHPFSVIANVANEIMEEDTPEGETLRGSLSNVRDEEQEDINKGLTGDELSVFSKAVVKLPRKERKGKNVVAESEATEATDDSWNDMRSIIHVLVSYGCLQTSTDGETDDEARTYILTQAGINLGMMGFSNSLWCLVAMGGAWDVAGTSSKLDSVRSKMDLWEDDDDSNTESGNEGGESQLHQKMLSVSRKEAETMVSLLRLLSPSEIAGFVSCLVAENSRSSGAGSLLETFKQLPFPLQRTIQQSLLLMDRLAEVQKIHSVDDTIGGCAFDITNCAVVSAWAAGCTWNEALAMSGTSPGDLARTLSRALDGLRQLGNLPYSPVRRKLDGIPILLGSPGIHPDIRRLCRDAARAVNRYPVKDPLALEDPSVDMVLVEDVNDDELSDAEEEETDSSSDDESDSQN